jgi:hypothetical protein
MNYTYTEIDGADIYTVAIADYRRKRWIWKIATASCGSSLSGVCCSQQCSQSRKRMPDHTREAMNGDAHHLSVGPDHRDQARLVPGEHPAHPVFLNE